MADLCDRPQPYVVIGEWTDAEWEALNRNPSRARTHEELKRVIAGPRPHPFGPDAYQVIAGGELRMYPNKEAAGGGA